MVAQVFISYKSEYFEFAQRLRDQLRKWGFGTWLDKDDIPEGTYFRDAIQKGLETSRFVLGILTPEALNSREVMWEWDYALRKNIFMPIRYRECELPYHLQGTEYIDFVKDEATAFDRLRNALTAVASPSSEVVSLPQQSRTKEERGFRANKTNRTLMLEKVQAFWVEGVLEKSLHSGAIDLEVEAKPESVLRHVEYGDYKLPGSAKIYDIFEDVNKELLILGAPGAGKTTLMLQLARDLISRAFSDEKRSIPVVLNLSSWAVKHESIDSWLIERLQFEYQFPRRLAKLWVENGVFLPLFDGLDEVSNAPAEGGLSLRDQCVTAINTFRQAYPFVDLVVCSRIADYDVLTNRLDLGGAILLQPLSETQIDNYTSGSELSGLRELIHADSIVRDMAGIPFLLNTMTFSYRGQSYKALSGYPTLEARRNHLFENFALKRFTPDSEYTLKAQYHYLSRLAKQLVTRDQIVFYIENMQPDWLSNARQRWRYRIFRLLAGVLVSLAILLLFPLLYAIYAAIAQAYEGTSYDVNQFWLSFVVLMIPIVIYAAVSGVLLLREGRIKTVEILGWSWHGLIRGAVVGAIFGAVIGGIISALLWLSAISDPHFDYNSPYYGVSYLFTETGFIFGIALTFFVLGVAPVGGFLLGTGTIETRTIPNQGIRRSIRNAIIVGIVGYFLVFFPNIFGLLFGGAAVIKHYVLRRILHRSGDIPWNYARFLDYCASVGLLRKVGGGYIFVHRYLLEYFAQLNV